MELRDLDGGVGRFSRVEGGEQGVERAHRQVWPAGVGGELLGEEGDPERELTHL